MNTSGNIILVKTKAFSLRAIRMYQHLSKEHKEFSMSTQFLRSATSIGANAREADSAQSKADFIAKFSISLKEANESQYWIELLYEGGYITDEEFNSMNKDCKEIIAIITSILKTSRNNYF